MSNSYLTLLACFSSCYAATGHSFIPLQSILSNFRSLIPIYHFTDILLLLLVKIFFGLPQCLFPPCEIQFMTTFVGQISGRRRICPVNRTRPFSTNKHRFLYSARTIASSFLILSVQDIFKILRKHLRWNASTSFITLVGTFHVSHLYKAVERIS